MVVDRKFTLGGSFTNMSSLAAAIEQVLQIGSSGASVTFANGQLTFSNVDDGVASNELVDLVLGRPGTASVFETAMNLTGNDLGLGETITSETLLDEASASDNLTDLFSAQGASLGLATGSVFTFDALEGGVQLPQATFTVSGAGDGTGADRQVMTLGGLADELEDVLQLGSIGSATIVDGALRVEGRAGLSHALTGLAFAQANNASLAPGMAFAQVQAATDVTHETSIKVHDSLGETHLLSLVFTKDADSDNRWTWQALVDDGQILAGATGAVTFNGDGSLESFTTDDGQPLQIDPANGADGPLSIELDAGVLGSVQGVTGFARESTTALVDQDGYAMGTLESISVGADGIIVGDFTNGTSRALAQVALADFTNPAGLMRDAGNGWMTTPNSGSPVIRRPGPGSSVGSISAGTLEMSNVDIAQEFTNMIVAQRGFQANARTITTSDEMLVELVNLKR
jgi:flagellar hook protein FlgE